MHRQDFVSLFPIAYTHDYRGKKVFIKIFVGRMRENVAEKERWIHVGYTYS